MDSSGRRAECDAIDQMCRTCGVIGTRACTMGGCTTGLACGGMCVNTSSDSANCGECGVTCATGTICAGGRCEVALDLLLMVDNSNSMRNPQAQFLQQVGPLVDLLTNPPCASASNPTPHVCTSDPADVPVYPRVVDMHVGVVSSDLGTPGYSVPGCSNSDLGDDGLLNPIRYGEALARHEPWTSAPATYGRPSDCTDPNQFPPFIRFGSALAGPAQFAHDFQCNAALYVNGCGLESDLDAVYRALVIHDASDARGNTSPNAGFLRESAVLAIVMLTDDDDGSVRDCRFANGTPCEGGGRTDVYNPASTFWSNMDLSMRFYMYRPCGPQDPTWPLSRYVDPANPNGGFLGLKPGHPERILFTAIAGVPLAVPMAGTGSTARIDWDGLLGVQGPGGADDFCGRDSSGLANLTSDEGGVSMAQANADPGCPNRVVPACRGEGMFNTSGCTADIQYFSPPSRRIVEIARRFDESPLCGGSRCNNGFVSSVCASNYAPAVGQIVRRIQSRLGR